MCCLCLSTSHLRVPFSRAHRYTVLADLGTHHAATRLQALHGQPLASMRTLMQFNGRLSGGTMATGILLDNADASTQAIRRDPFALGGAPPAGSEGASSHADPISAEYDNDLGCWTAPFWMADIDSRVVRRSSGLFRQAASSPFADAFCYRERALAADESVAINMAKSVNPPVEKREMMVKRGRLPSPGQGPSEEVRAKSWFRLFYWAEAADTSALLTSVEGGDPGYEETSKMVSEAAILLATRRDELPAARMTRRLANGASGHGGMLTPAFALGGALVDALDVRGLSFEEHAVVDAGAMREAAAQALREHAAKPRTQL